MEEAELFASEDLASQRKYCLHPMYDSSNTMFGDLPVKRFTSFEIYQSRKSQKSAPILPLSSRFQKCLSSQSFWL